MNVVAFKQPDADGNDGIRFKEYDNFAAVEMFWFDDDGTAHDGESITLDNATLKALQELVAEAHICAKCGKLYYARPDCPKCGHREEEDSNI